MILSALALSLTLMGLVQAPPARPAARETAIAKSGSTTIGATSAGKVASVTIRTATIDRSNPAFPLNMEPQVKAVTIIQALDIAVGDQPVFVSRSVFADLIDPGGATLRFERGLFVLTITGGDGADSYSVRAYFDAMEVRRRMVFSLLIPDKPTEDTRYWFRVLQDKEK